jgi:hypothetical protein
MAMAPNDEGTIVGDFFNAAGVEHGYIRARQGAAAEMSGRMDGTEELNSHRRECSAIPFLI